MTSFLDGPLAAAIHAGFKGKLLKGKLTRKTSSSVDSNNDPKPGTPLEFACEGLVDSFSAVFRATAGIPDTDVRIMIIANSISTEPNKDDVVQFSRASGTQKYQIRKLLEIDPARATFTLQGYLIDGT